MRQILLQNASGLILQNVTVLLQNATVLLQMRQLLQNEKFATNYDSADYKKYFLFFYFFIECARPVHFPLLSWSKSIRELRCIP